jgi:hypothetical protein
MRSNQWNRVIYRLWSPIYDDLFGLDLSPDMLARACGKLPLQDQADMLSAPNAEIRTAGADCRAG